MYTKTARFYDAIYGFKDYERECDVLRGLIESHKRSAGRRLLDVACGTGKHLEILNEDYECQGLDLDPVLLDEARKRVPELQLYEGDMASFHLDQSFDVVTCLFSAIGYVESTGRLQAALRCFAEHTKPGGVVVVEPWFGPDKYIPGHLHALFVDLPDLKIARMSISECEDNTSVMKMHYVIGRPDGIDHAVEEHRLGLFTHEEYMTALDQAGLSPEFDSEGLTGRGLYLGSKSL